MKRFFTLGLAGIACLLFVLSSVTLLLPAPIASAAACTSSQKSSDTFELNGNKIIETDINYTNTNFRGQTTCQKDGPNYTTYSKGSSGTYNYTNNSNCKSIITLAGSGAGPATLKQQQTVASGAHGGIAQCNSSSTYKTSSITVADNQPNHSCTTSTKITYAFSGNDITETTNTMDPNTCVSSSHTRTFAGDSAAKVFTAINQVGSRIQSCSAASSTITLSAAGSSSGIYVDNVAGSCNKNEHTVQISGTSPQPKNHDDVLTCESSGGALGWIICPVIDGLQNVIGGVFDNFIQPLLKTKPLSTDPASPVYKAWSNFRIYGDVFLVIALVIVVFGESIGGGLIDAYTAKKILPRLLITALLMNISYYLVSTMIDITNIIGNGIMDLLTAPFGLTGDFTISIGKTGSVGMTAGLGAAVVWGAAGIAADGFMAWFWAVIFLPMLLIILGILVVVLLRWALIMFLVIISPVAFALYCLPNTEKYFKKWWDTLFETLMIYPIIGALFAMGKIASYLISNDPTGTGIGGGLLGAVADILAVVALIIPLALIPFAFKLAGGILSRAHDAVSGARSWAHGMNQTRREDAKQRFGAGRADVKSKTLNRAFRNAGGTARGLARVPGVGRLAGRAADRAQNRVSMLQAEMMKNPRLAPVANDEMALRAGMAGSRAEAIRRLTEEQGLSRAEASAAADRWHATGLGWSQSGQIAALGAATADGTVFRNGADQKELISHITGSNDALQRRVWGNTYAGNKAAGRYDLSEAYGAGLSKVQRISRGEVVTEQEHAQAAVEGIRSVSNTELSRIKGMGMENASRSMQQVFEVTAAALADPNAGVAPDPVTGVVNPAQVTLRREELETQRAEAVSKLLNLRDSGAYIPESLLGILEQNVGSTGAARDAVADVAQQVNANSVEAGLRERARADTRNTDERFIDGGSFNPATETISAERPRGRAAYDPNHDPNMNNQAPPPAQEGP